MTKQEKKLKIFKYIGLIIYSLITLFMIYMLCAFIPDYIAKTDLWKLGGAICMLVTLYASIGYIIPITLGIIGTVISKKIQNAKSKRNSILMIIVPIITTVLNFITYLILLI